MTHREDLCYEQPCPRCGISAGWTRIVLRRVAVYFDNNGNYEDELEFANEDEYINEIAVCRTEGCGRELDEVTTC